MPPTVFLIEDNEGDIILTLEALSHAGVQDVQVARDGQEALEILDMTDALPDLILLDINLPRIDGLEVLVILKKSEKLRSIPVVMLTTSSSERDIAAAYENYANCYVVKAVDLETFLGVIVKITSFWFGVVTLPAAPNKR